MGNDFRPVKTIWGEHASCFMPVDYVVKTLEGLADLACCETSSERDGQYTEVWISDGKLFFDSIRVETRSPQELAEELGAELGISLLSPQDVEESEAAGDDLTDAATEAQFVSFMEALRANARGWQINDLDPKDGSIRFYVG